MKKVLNAIGSFFGTLIGLVIMLLVGIGFLIYLPFDYIKYKCSLYYKHEHKKYTLFAGLSVYFKIYNIILKNDLPIKYYKLNYDSLSQGRFIYDKILVVPDVVLEYDEAREDWVIKINDDSHEPDIKGLSEYLDEEICIVNEKLGQTVCKKAVVLVEGDSGNIENVEKASDDGRFLIYDNLEETLKIFCEGDCNG